MLTLSNGTQIQLSPKPLGRGGEGEVFEIKSPKNQINNVAKVFFDNKRTSESEQKLKYLISNPPQIAENGHTYLIWALDLLYDNGKFIGFIMPRAEGIELEVICDDDFLNYKQYQGSIWEKFAFSQPNSIFIRLKIAYNICAAIASIHSKGNYILVDLKPVNIKITENGLICIIDLDSVQITERGKVLFPSKVATPEYSPPEVSKKLTIKDEYWDRFSLAVILYRILIGIHPFSGSLNPPFDKLTVYEDLIKGGFYPHGKRKKDFAVINAKHNYLFKYSDSVVDNFVKCFDTFIFQPNNRPSAVEWCNSLIAKPEIINFKADKKVLVEGQEVKLSWTVKNATRLSINGNIDVTGQNDYTIQLKTTSSFFMQATNIFGDVFSKKNDVDVIPMPKIEIVFPAPNFDISFNSKAVSTQLPDLSFYFSFDTEKLTKIDEKLLVSKNGFGVENILTNRIKKILKNTFLVLSIISISLLIGFYLSLAV